VLQRDDDTLAGVFGENNVCSHPHMFTYRWIH
jgi:hypothetical protein